MAAGLAGHARANPTRLHVADEVRAFTRAEFNARTNQLIDYLWSRGVRPGDSAAIMAGNGADFMTAVCATALGGISLVPVNWHLTAAEAHFILESSGAKALFLDATHRAVASAAVKDTGCSVICDLGELDRLLEGCSAEEPPDDTPFASPVYHTSGTTGRPKATRMTQNPRGMPVSEALAAVRGSVGARGLGEDTVQLTMGPLYHGGPLNSAFTAVIVGGVNHIMRRFDAEEALRLIERHRVTHTIMVPIMFVRLLRLPDAVRARYDVSSLRRVFHIAATMPIDVKQKMIEWWGPVLFDGYGSSEIGVVTVIDSQQWLDKPGSVGRPVRTLTIQIIGEDGQELPPGEVGMIYITSLTEVDLVYLGDAEKTAAAHRGEKQFTLGDMGWLDEDGYLFLADRRVDLIVSGGVNIYPAEIESELLAHPAVDDACVFGIPDPEWGQSVKAAVVPREGYRGSPALEADIVSWLGQRVARYKLPRSIDFRRELPRYANGKLHRRELRDPYWQHTQGVDRASP